MLTVNEHSKKQYVEWNNSVGFILLAKNDNGEWWTLISETLQDSDNTFVKKNPSGPGTHYQNSKQFKINKNTKFGTSNNPDIPAWPDTSFVFDKSNDQWKKLFDEDGGFHLTIKNTSIRTDNSARGKIEEIRWKFILGGDNKEVSIDKLSIMDIYLYDKHGRGSWKFSFKQ